MPYVIRRERAGYYTVRKKFGGRIVGRTDSREKAKAMIRAIYASEGRRGQE